MVDTTKSRAARTVRGGLAALTAVLVLVAGSAPVSAHHDLYRRVSAGQRFGNGAFAASFEAVSADGKRVFFESAERLVLGDVDSSVDVWERSGGTTKRISSGAINGNGPFGASLMAISADGTRAFFVTSEQLVSGDTDTLQDVYERTAGVTTQVSAGAINGNSQISALFAGVSSDGTKVFFTTAESLVAADTDGLTDIYERSAGTTKLVSAGQVNGNGPFEVTFARASANGARIWFTTHEQLVGTDTDTQQDVYERSSGITFKISRGVINGNGAFSSNFAGASSNGPRVFFSTNEVLVSSDTDSAFDIYEFSSGGTITLISAGAINGNGPNQVTFRGASADGTRVFFTTTEQLITSDIDAVDDIYQRSAGVTTRESATAFNGNGDFPANFQATSADGLRVFFTSFEKLAGTDTDASSDVYETSAAATKLVSAGTINGNGAFNALLGGISADGTRVFFRSSEQLASEDDDTAGDIYERAGGTTELVTIGAANVDVSYRGCTPDGLAVFFETTEKLLASDKDTVTDVYGAYDAF